MQISNKSKIRTFWGWISVENKNTQSQVSFLDLIYSKDCISEAVDIDISALKYQKWKMKNKPQLELYQEVRISR